MESAGRAARDDDEGEREHRRRPGRGGIDRRRRERRIGEEESGVHRRHAKIEQQAVGVVAGLQQEPHRQHAGGERVRQQQPLPLRQRRSDDRILSAGPDEQQQRPERPCRQRAEAPAQAVYGEAHAHGDQHERQRRQHRFRVEVGREQRGDDVDEHAHRQGDQKEDEQVEQRLGALSDQALGHLADGQAPRADGNGERAEVLDRADEDGAQHDPQQRRQPAPDDGDRRTQHRRQSRNRGELVAEQHVAVGRHVVRVVAQRVGRGGPGVVQLEQPPRQVRGVEAVRQPVRRERQQRHRNR